jgi:hypothetical protein
MGSLAAPTSGLDLFSLRSFRCLIFKKQPSYVKSLDASNRARYFFGLVEFNLCKVGTVRSPRLLSARNFLLLWLLPFNRPSLANVRAPGSIESGLGGQQHPGQTEFPGCCGRRRADENL